MGFYANHIVPRLVDLACGVRPVARQREKIVPQAQGLVVEIGIGSGLNLPFYDAAKVKEVIGVDPAPPAARRLTEKRAEGIGFPVSVQQASAEEIPLGDNQADSVVITYSLCTIPDAMAALAEIKRVLKPSGALLFCEHGLAPDESVRRWQGRINPIWRRLAGGCNLNRDIPALITGAGFDIRKLETLYLPGLKIATYNYWGSAKASH